jgi:predicted acetyltransferase
MKTDSHDVRLESVAIGDRDILANLVELYLHDLSETFPIDPGPAGRFGYEKLPLYWSEPERRFPFFIRRGDRIAGFVLITIGSPASDDPEVCDIAEFFILRRHRRSGVGSVAACLAWDRFPWRWTVRVSLGNKGALPFWQETIRAYTNNGATASQRSGSPHDWRVFSFESRRLSNT